MVKSTRLIMACALVILLVASGINYEVKASGPREVQLKADPNKVLLRAASIDTRFTDNVKGSFELPLDGGYYLVKPHVKDLIITGQGTMNLAEVRLERP